MAAGRMWGRSTLESSRKTDPSLSLGLLKAVIEYIPVPRGFSSESLQRLLISVGLGTALLVHKSSLNLINTKSLLWSDGD